MMDSGWNSATTRPMRVAAWTVMARYAASNDISRRGVPRVEPALEQRPLGLDRRGECAEHRERASAGVVASHRLHARGVRCDNVPSAELVADRPEVRVAHACAEGRLGGFRKVVVQQLVGRAREGAAVDVAKASRSPVHAMTGLDASGIGEVGPHATGGCRLIQGENESAATRSAAPTPSRVGVAGAAADWLDWRGAHSATASSATTK